MTDAAPRPLIVVMGVSAAGKSSIGHEMARALEVSFVDADDLHPPENVAKMAAGVALDDHDRGPWLDAVGRQLAQSTGVVIACSALKRAYRDRLRLSAPSVIFVHLHGTHDVLATRAAKRKDHFMPPTLLLSQLDTLERLGTDEAGIEIDVDAPVDEITGTALEWVDAHAR
ncbi:gluconokinase [Microbacterium lacus]|uniref:gluconokinase n=1 Tax=Microbacterium lacus TaxID=415217 RepID=UPI00384AC5C2